MIYLKTIVYTNFNNFKKKNSIAELIWGIIFIAIAFAGLFLDSKLILKLFMYIIPLALLLYSIRIYKIAFYFKKNNLKNFIIFLIQGILLTLAAIYIIWFPIESLNYIIIIGGILLIINSLNKMMITGSTTFAFLPFLMGILCILFSNQIINTFYTLFLIIVLFIGVSKIMNFFYLRK